MARAEVVPIARRRRSSSSRFRWTELRSRRTLVVATCSGPGVDVYTQTLVSEVMVARTCSLRSPPSLGASSHRNRPRLQAAVAPRHPVSMTAPPGPSVTATGLRWCSWSGRRRRRRCWTPAVRSTRSRTTANSSSARSSRRSRARRGRCRSRASQRPARNAGSDRSPRPAPGTPGGCSSKPAGITAHDRALAERQTDQPPEAIAVSWSAQRRLHRIRTRLEDRGKRRTIIAVAAARELGGFCWAITQIE